MVPLLLGRASVDTQLAKPRAMSLLREVAGMARAQGLTAELVGAALGFADAELWNNRPTAESVDLLEEALSALGTVETVERSRILSKLSRALLYIGASERAHDLMHEARALAERLNDVPSRRELLWCELMPFGLPPSGGQFGERRQLLRRIQQLAEEDGDYKYLTNSIAVTAPAFLEMGDVAEFEAIVQRYARLGTFDESRVDEWSLTTMQVMDAILKGEFSAAERLATKAMEFGDSEFDTPVGIYGMQMFTIRREQGRLAEIAPLLKRFMEENPENAAWRPGLMLVASDLGFAQQARKTFDSLAAGDFTVPVDTTRTITLSYLAEVCCGLGDRNNAERLYELLLPYRDLAVVVGQSTVCCGAAARYLGMLAATMRDWSAAEAHFESALAMDERMKAWPWLAHTRFEYSRALLASGRKKDKSRAHELRARALAAAERLGMGRLTHRISTEAQPG
jgi:tetratricopeptide (TPR) repeat protein